MNKQGNRRHQTSPPPVLPYGSYFLSICRTGIAFVWPTIGKHDVIGKPEIHNTRMWANAQRDGRPAEYRWRPLFNVAVWLIPTTTVPCSNAAKTRNPLKLAGAPQTTGPISVSAASEPKFTIL